MKQVLSISHGDFKAQIKELKPTLYKVEICSLFVVYASTKDEAMEVISNYYKLYTGDELYNERTKTI